MELEWIGVPAIADICLHILIPQHRVIRKLLRNTYGLHIEMTIDQDGLLLWIVADPSDDCRRKVQDPVLRVLLAERDGLCLDTKLVQLSLEPAAHSLHILATTRITADTVYAHLG